MGDGDLGLWKSSSRAWRLVGKGLQTKGTEQERVAGNCPLGGRGAARAWAGTLALQMQKALTLCPQRALPGQDPGHSRAMGREHSPDVEGMQSTSAAHICPCTRGPGDETDALVRGLTPVPALSLAPISPGPFPCLHLLSLLRLTRSSPVPRTRGTAAMSLPGSRRSSTGSRR